MQAWNAKMFYASFIEALIF